MLIEVVIPEWEQACCGLPFTIGDAATWTLVAIPPQRGRGALFTQENHDQTPDDVPHWAVTGTVKAISAIRYPSVPVPGESRSYTLDYSRPTSQELTGVDGPADVDHHEYRVLLEVAEGTDLPAYQFGTAATAQRDLDVEGANRRRERMGDEVGVLLEALADDAQQRYGTIARVFRSSDRSAVTIEPLQDNTAAVYWARTDGDGDGISVQVGDGKWRFPPSAHHVEVVRILLDAAVHGWVEEHVRPEVAPSRLETKVIAANGRSWTATRTFEPFVTDGFSAVSGELWARVQRGEHVYRPWETDDL